jgi:ribosomal protein L17
MANVIYKLVSETAKAREEDIKNVGSRGADRSKAIKKILVRELMSSRKMYVRHAIRVVNSFMKDNQTYFDTFYKKDLVKYEGVEGVDEVIDGLSEKPEVKDVGDVNKAPGYSYEPSSKATSVSSGLGLGGCVDSLGNIASKVAAGLGKVFDKSVDVLDDHGSFKANLQKAFEASVDLNTEIDNFCSGKAKNKSEIIRNIDKLGRKLIQAEKISNTSRTKKELEKNSDKMAVLSLTKDINRKMKEAKTKMSKDKRLKEEAKVLDKVADVLKSIFEIMKNLFRSLFNRKATADEAKPQLASV